MSLANTILYARATPVSGEGEVEEEVIDGDSDESQHILETIAENEERRR